MEGNASIGLKGNSHHKWHADDTHLGWVRIFFEYLGNGGICGLKLFLMLLRLSCDGSLNWHILTRPFGAFVIRSFLNVFLTCFVYGPMFSSLKVSLAVLIRGFIPQLTFRVCLVGNYLFCYCLVAASSPIVCSGFYRVWASKLQHLNLYSLTIFELIEL